jgi:predicted lipoprotein with Yx(FWY)xxD motif
MHHFPNGMRLLVGAAMLAVLTIAAAAAFAAGGNAVVKVGPSNLGRVLVDAHGKTLYI